MAVKLNQQQRALIDRVEQPRSKEKAIEVKNLVISFKTDNGKVQAVRGVSFDLHKGETLCIVGESGSGKSVTSKAIMGILSSNAIVEGGQILYEGEDLLKVSEEEYHRIRGHKIGMIFQDPLSSLNPIVKIGKQIIETMLINSNQLKNHYAELIAKELVAYKNEKVIRDAEITRAENEYDELLAACKKAEKEADKASLPTIKAENKEKLLAKKAERDEIIKKAKDHYKEVAPGLKEALKARKASAKIENKEYAEQLKKDCDEKLLALDEKEKAITISPENQERLDELEAKIKAIKRNYSIRITLSYFLNKHKQALREKEAKELAPLIEERNALAKEFDEIKAEREAILDDYQSHINITKAMAKKKAIAVMREVGIPQPEKRFKQYPFEFSGGMRQRIVIAIALIAQPDILICDEPTTALDVTIQAQILELINRLKESHHMSVIFITHDLGVVANMADRVAVMYAGKICEYGLEKEIFFDPRHPYTWALLSSIPDIDSKEKLEVIPGTPPDMIYPPEGDAFALRNRYALGIDFKHEPPYFKISETHYVASWLEHESAPDIEPPAIVKARIYNALKEEAERSKK